MATNRRERVISAGGVVALHAAMLLLVLHARARQVTPTAERSLVAFDVVTPPPVPPPPKPDRERAPRKTGDAGQAGVAESRSAVVAPHPIVVPPVPPVAAPLLSGEGSAAIGGTATLGTGTGAGLAGTEPGNGREGDGGGSGGGVRARLVSGAIGPRDYPKAERRARIEGSVTAGFVVDANGRVADCKVVQSSGNEKLDTITCRLIAARFRYEPARDASGRAISERRGWRQRWWIE
jgi:protein TonB